MALVHAHLEYLVNRCGDRRIGTPGNQKAAEYIVQALESAGYDCTLERFRSPGGIQAPNAAAMLTGFFASWLMSRRGWQSYSVGLGFAGLMAAMIIGENTTRFQPAHYFVPRREGRNVLARPHGSRVPNVLVVAHYDTVNQGTAFDERWVRFVPAGLRAYALFPPLAVLLSRSRRKLPGRLFRLAMLAGAASMVQWQLLGGHNPGANDNGSGVAVALAAAERLAVGTAHGEAWFLFTDGEEAGITGMRAFLKAHAGELGQSVVLNLEAQGAGGLYYLGREGMLFRYRPPTQLLAHVEAFAACGGPAPQRRDQPAFSTDALAARAVGLRAVTVVRLDENGLMPGWHHNDYLERIDGAALEESVDFAAGFTAFLLDVFNR